MTKLLPKGLSIITILGIVGLGGALYASHIVQAQEDVSCVAFESEITSDSETMVNSTSSVAVDNDTATEGNQVPSAWTADIEGATWIWSDAQNDGAASPGTEVFTRDFMFSSDATSTAVLKIATDNTYEVRLNGVLLGSSTDEVNFTLATQDQHDLSSELVDGLNTLEITVTNLNGSGDNPAGLLYRLDLAGFECEEPVIQPTGEILQPEEDEEVSGTTTLLATYNDGDEVNDDAVQWAVRSEGACNDGSKTVLGNVNGHDDPFDWDGMTFEAMFDTTEVSDGSYCFVFNPIEDEGQDDVRLTRLFTVNNVDEGGDDDDEERDEKVFVCHLPGGDESKAKTLHINSDSLEDHLAHGDHEGECEGEIESSDNRGNRGNGRR